MLEFGGWNPTLTRSKIWPTSHLNSFESTSSHRRDERLVPWWRIPDRFQGHPHERKLEAPAEILATDSEENEEQETKAEPPGQFPPVAYR